MLAKKKKKKEQRENGAFKKHFYFIEEEGVDFNLAYFHIKLQNEVFFSF